MPTVDTTLLTLDSTLVRLDSTVVTGDGWEPATPGPDGFRLELGFGGVWVDVTDRVDLGQGMTLQVGRSSVWDDASPGTLAVTLDNGDGALTPDNPLSPWWPYVGEDVDVRVIVSHDGTAWRRFRGTVDSWAPAFSRDGSTVAVSATDRLAALTRPMPSAVQQYLEGTSWGAGTGWSLLELGADVGTVANAAADGPAGTLVHDTRARAQITSADAGTLGIAGAWSWDTGVSGRRGSALTVEVPSTARTCGGLWLQQGTAVTADEGYDVLATARDVAGVPVWQLTLGYGAGGTLLQVRSRDGAVVYTVSGVLSDGAWHAITWRTSSTSFGGPATRFALDGVGIITLASANPADVASIDYAALIDRRVKTVTRQVRASLGGLWWAGPSGTGAATVAEVIARGAGTSVAAWPTVLAELAASVTGALYTATALGGDTRPVRRVNGGGRTTLEHLQALARTVGGVVWHESETDAVVVAGPGAAPAASALTIEAGADDTDVQGWSRGIDARPSRVTASAPVTGAVTATSAGTVRREQTVETLAPTEADLYGIATWALNRARALRATSVGVDLTTAEHDLWADVMALRPGHRITLAGLDPQLYGRSALDLLVVGWVEEWGPGRCVVTLTTDAADDPAEGVYDTARWSGSGLRLTASVSSSATTLALASDDGVLLSTQPGDYPLDLDVSGERVTVTAAPIAPVAGVQTLTVVRGVPPTVARAHPVDEPVELWLAPTWAL